MRVLMFGWEFPPHLSGGLARATVAYIIFVNVLQNLEQAVSPEAAREEAAELANRPAMAEMACVA